MFLSARGCAALGPLVPLAIGGGILLVWLMERFPELFGHMLELDYPDNTEDPEDPDLD